MRHFRSNGPDFSILALSSSLPAIVGAESTHGGSEWANRGNLEGLFGEPISWRDIDQASLGGLTINGIAGALKMLYNLQGADDLNWHHGDLRPANIVIFIDDPNDVDNFGCFKITDQGLAKSMISLPASGGYLVRAVSPRDV
ncbi:hypothetical protein GGS21DRAFT_250618 [Xylaria nigripes]|nr:hypothetical protein GGS21DRAFT_250618 [Xylaria nigripes]